jgi:Glycosyl hydrolase family 46
MRHGPRAIEEGDMRKNRREFLRSAGRWCASSALIGVSVPLARGATVEKPLRPETQGMPMPQVSAHNPDADLVRRIKAISNVFEVGDPEPDYSYVEDLGDGRGYTVTQYGFCTYNTEVPQVIERYAAHVPDTPLKRYLPQLPPVKWTHQVLDGFAAAWRKEIKASKLLGRACDEEADVLYFNPAVEAAAQLGVHSAIGKAIFYDTLLQHGTSTDPDSLPTIIKRTLEEHGDVESSSEAEFLKAFLNIRRSILEDPSNHDTRAVWRASARRIDALGKLLDGNPDLVPPIQVSNADVDLTVL